MLFYSCQEPPKTTNTQIATPYLNSKTLDLKYFELKNAQLFYNNMPYSGLYYTYHKNDSLKSIENYTNGKKHQTYTSYYPSGEKHTERYYTNGLKTGVHCGWWPDKSPKFIYHFNTLGQYHGTVKEWYTTGHPATAFNYTNGREQGVQKAWKTDGRIKANYDVIGTERFGLIGLKRCYTVKKGLNNVSK